MYHTLRFLVCCCLAIVGLIAFIEVVFSFASITLVCSSSPRIGRLTQCLANKYQQDQCAYQDYKGGNR